MAYHYALFSLGPRDLKPSKAELAVAMLGLFNTVDPTRILAFNNELIDHCKSRISTHIPHSSGTGGYSSYFGPSENTGMLEKIWGRHASVP